MNSLIENKILLFAEKTFIELGYYGTTIEKVATAADTNKATVYYYFRSKENIFGLVIKRILTMIWAALNIESLYQKNNFKIISYQESNINLPQIVWFIVNELKTNKQIMVRLMENDDLTKKLFHASFNDPQNFEVLKKIVAFQLTETFKVN